LQPASASAATDISDQTILRMGKPLYWKMKLGEYTEFAGDDAALSAGEVSSIAEKVTSAQKSSQTDGGSGVPCSSIYIA